MEHPAVLGVATKPKYQQKVNLSSFVVDSWAWKSVGREITSLGVWNMAWILYTSGVIHFTESDMSLTPISKIGVGLTASLRAGLQKPWRIIPATQIIWFLIWASHNSLQVHCQQWPLTCFAENTKACLPLVPSEKYNAHTHGEELPSAYTCGRCNAHTKNTWKYTLIIGLQHTYVDIYFVTVQILRTNKSWHF